MEKIIKKYILWGSVLYLVSGIVFFIVSGLFNIKYTNILGDVLAITIFTVLSVWIYDAIKDEVRPILVAASSFAIFIIISIIVIIIFKALTENGDHWNGIAEFIYSYQHDGEFGFFKKLFYGVLLGGFFYFKPNLISIGLSIVICYLKEYITTKKAGK